MSDLLDAVDALTVPQQTRQRQDILQKYTVEDEEGGVTEHQRVIGQQTVTVVQEPLLEQLDEAIRSDLGSTAKGASLAHERSILDADALYQFMVISSQIKDWCRIVGVTPNRKPGENLRAWYAATLSRRLDDAGAEFYVGRLRHWAGLIRAKLDPARERELPDPCPVCGAGEWWRDGERYFHPLIVRYRPSGPDMVQQARALCRACEQVWGVRELAFLLEHAEVG